FGPAHPMAPIRVDLTMRLAEELGVLTALPTVSAPVASDDLLATVHEPKYIEAVKVVGKDPYQVDEAHGLGSADNPTFRGMHRASAHVVGASVEAARRVWS